MFNVCNAENKNTAVIKCHILGLFMVKQTNKKTPSRTFVLFVFVTNDDLVHVDILLICTCKETAKCVKMLRSVSRFLVKKKRVSREVSEVLCALS